MNRNQAIALIVAAANVALIALFPPFDTYSLGKNQLPVFGGFYFYFGRNNSMIVNSSLLFLSSSSFRSTPRSPFYCCARTSCS